MANQTNELRVFISSTFRDPPRRKEREHKETINE